jgi:hypothetical protein
MSSEISEDNDDDNSLLSVWTAGARARSSAG